ncbi:hypothetical protein UF06_19025, partial [Vibrio sp. S234-5]
MDGSLPVVSIVGAAESPANNGHPLTKPPCMVRIHPTQEAVAKLGKINICNQTSKGIVDRHTVFKQPLFKKLVGVARNIFTKVSLALTSGDHGPDRQKQNIKQRIIICCPLPFVTVDTEMRFVGIN